MSTHFVYMLFDSSKLCPIYVGATINLKHRLSCHKSSTLKYYESKENISIEILDEANDKSVKQLEQYWYWQIRAWGFELIQKDCREYRQPNDIGYSFYEIAKLAIAFEKSTQTINRWIKSNDDRLTSEKAKAALLKPKK